MASNGKSETPSCPDRNVPPSNGVDGIRAAPISLPKGGGAIHGLGETFDVRLASGTGSLTFPIPTSASRDFHPMLNLKYNSANGNGVFGLGWELNQEFITRKTDKGIPRYRDDDVFVFMGEDLVPINLDEKGNVIPDERRGQYSVRRYAPSVEEKFHRIECWTQIDDPKQVFWKATSPDNITSIFGKDESSRIQDPSSTHRIFRWFVCEMYDCKGNARAFNYKPEDSVGIPASANESNRTQHVNLYLKRIKYGNLDSKRDEKSWAPVNHPTRWMLSIVLDYGEHNSDVPTTLEELPWSCREDPFSKFRSGFEVRTYRLCQRILMFHHFPEETPKLQDYLVSSTNFTYDLNPFAAYLTSITQVGYLWKNKKYSKKFFPSLDLSYTLFPSDSKLDEITAAEFMPDSLRNLPQGMYGKNYQFLDLYGEGLPGIFVEQGSEWFYMRNNGPSKSGKPQFGNLEILPSRPSATFESEQARFMDLAGVGHLHLVVGLNGFFENTDVDWSNFRSFLSRPNLDLRDPNVKLLDLTGDGLADLLVSEDQVFTWYHSLGEDGYEEGGRHIWTVLEDQGPRVVFGDAEQAIYLADMSGDGLSDILRVRNGNVCYWPNLGYARFGPKITMNNSPLFDSPELFTQERVLVADIDGSGNADILYTSSKGITMYLNQSGNGLSKGKLLRFPGSDTLSSVKTVDLFGNGTVCLVWSSALPSATPAFKFWNPLDGVKPHLLTDVTNNIGAETHITYSPSTKFYLQDKRAGTPWITPLPITVHCIECVEIYDRISKNRYSRRYAYHHGYYDGVEREYRGFAMVEEWDTDTEAPDATNIHPASNVPPIYIKTWYHTGAYSERQKISTYLANEYYGGQELQLEDTILPSGLTAFETRKACRSLKGRLLRRELYAQDGTKRELHPYTVDEYNYTIKVLAKRDNLNTVLSVHPRESLHFDLERNLAEPRLLHEMLLEVDSYGNTLQSVAIFQGRSKSRSKLKEQTETVVKYTSNRFAKSIDNADNYRHSMPSETKTYQLYGIDEPVTFEDFSHRLNPERMVDIPYNSDGSDGQKRLLFASRSLYRSDDLSDVLGLHTVESLGVLAETFELVLTRDLVEGVFQCEGRALFVDTETLENAGYVQFKDNANWWWNPSGRIFFDNNKETQPSQELREARSHFFMPQRTRDPFREDTITTYDPYDLLVATVTDASGNTFRATNDYRTLAPSLIADPNGNRTGSVTDELGMVIATAVMGKESECLGDSLDHFPEESINDLLIDPENVAANYLGSVTQRFIYDLESYRRDNQPVFSAIISRETHASETEGNPKVQIGFTYCDGFGRDIQRKANAGRGPDDKWRWLATGWTVFNNKGKPVRKYEPFFTNTHHFEFENQAGVGSLFIYDPRERVIATINPDHTWTKTIFDPWSRQEWDANDTAKINPPEDLDMGRYFAGLPECEYLPTWWEERINGSKGENEKSAATKAEKHCYTSTVIDLDSLNRKISTTEDSGLAKLSTNYVLDLQGNIKRLIDARARIVERNDYDMKGRVVHRASMDSGERWTLYDARGNKILGWDSRKQQFRYVYDVMGRPMDVFLSRDMEKEILIERVVYGALMETNTRGRVSQTFDQGGTINMEYDFKGNIISVQRELASEYKTVAECPRRVQTDFVTRSRYDALNREVERALPDGTVIHYEFNEVGFISGIKANIGGSRTCTTFIAKSEYNARGQRVLVNYGNRVTSQYTYDPITFRLSNLKSCRGDDSLQNQSYFYDPVGNITEILDDAQQTQFFSEKAVDPTVSYTYDALYRLTEASGRDNLGERTSDAEMIPHPGKGETTARYTQIYQYDDAGNMLSLGHQRAGKSVFTRKYSYTEDSLLQPGEEKNNRLSQMTVAGNTDTYIYEGLSGLHGNMTRMQGLSSLTWDHRDQLQSTQSDDGPETTYYVYDNRGIRLRKVTERDGKITNDHIYMDQWERRHTSDGASQTVHIMDLKQRIALVETRNESSSTASKELIRYQFTNHVNSVNLELDAQGDILTYEEYTPYGTTAYLATTPLTAAKRFRFTSQERDEETAFYYHSARYYCPKICRWINCDPIGTRDGPNIYLYVRCNPVNLNDPSGTVALFNVITSSLTGAVFGALGYLGGGMWRGATEQYGNMNDRQKTRLVTHFVIGLGITTVATISTGLSSDYGSVAHMEQTALTGVSIMAASGMASLGSGIYKGLMDAVQNRSRLGSAVMFGSVGGGVRGLVTPLFPSLPCADLLDKTHADITTLNALITGGSYVVEKKLNNEDLSLTDGLKRVASSTALGVTFKYLKGAAVRSLTLKHVSKTSGVTSG